MGAAAIPLIMAGVSAVGSIQQGRQQSAALKQQSDLAARNAALLQDQARTARLQAGAEEDAQRAQARRLLATQRAAIAQSGIGTGGTAGLLIEDSAIQAELDALNIRYGGEQQARSLLNQASMAGAEADILQDNARQANQAGLIGAGTSLLSGAGKAYASGAFGRSAGGVNLQGRTAPLLNNPAYVRRM